MMTPVTEIPDFLFHYTSIESLAMILSTKKIRFTALDMVDDLNEGKSLDLDNYGKFCFVSCWTDLKEESLPFWNMYTPNMKGVRIKMLSNLFKLYSVRYPAINDRIYHCLVPQERFITSDYQIAASKQYLNKVNYTNDEQLLIPTLGSISEEGYSIHHGKIGRFKAKHWRFQSEWRYIIAILPSTNKFKTNEEFKNFLKHGEIPFSYFYVDIDEDKFSQMEILLGPKHSEAEKVIVESLISRFNPSAKLIVSDLPKKIR